MTKSEFFSKLNDYATIIQSVAANLTQNQEQAHKLYLETIYHASKDTTGVYRHLGFRAWIVMTMRNVFLTKFNSIA